MKRHFCFLLVLFVSISIVGCGNASAKNDSANTIEFETINNTETKVETESVSSVSEPEVATEVAEATAEPADSNYSGKLYTLPVGSASEVWTEAQLDSYLKDCKAYQNNCQPNEKGVVFLDIDAFMKDFGFEYIGTFEEKGYASYNVYWKKNKGVKTVVTFTGASHFFIFMDGDSDSACVVFDGAENRAGDTKVCIDTAHFTKTFPSDTTLVYIKGIAASLQAISNMDNLDCGRLPYAADYTLKYSLDGRSFNLVPELDFGSGDTGFTSEEVYR